MDRCLIFKIFIFKYADLFLYNNNIKRLYIIRQQNKINISKSG